MDAGNAWIVLFLILTPVASNAWRDERSDKRREPRDPREMRDPRDPRESRDAREHRDARESRDPREMRRGGNIHYHSKRHMIVEPDLKRTDRTTKPPREVRKKPSGHLKPLEDDDIEIDEVVSVAIGPPPMRPRFDKLHKKQPLRQMKEEPHSNNFTAVELVKDVLSQLGREFLTRDVNENFIFGQYVGNSMKNLTHELRLKMQHEILDLIVKYHNNSVDLEKDRHRSTPKDSRVEKTERKFVAGGNETDDVWPDFSNLAKIVR